MSTEIDEYRAAAENRAKNKIAQRIRNDSMAHAKVLIETMIGFMPTAGDSVGIYSGRLPKEAYEKSLRETNAKQVTILVDDSRDLEWLNDLPPPQKGRIKVFQIAKPRPNHFLFVSSGAFRFEIDHKRSAAEANFNEQNVVSALEKAIVTYTADSSQVFPK